jgi:hypothetical protein
MDGGTKMKPKRPYHLPRPSSRMENVLTWTSIVVVLIAATAILIWVLKNDHIHKIVH